MARRAALIAVLCAACGAPSALPAPDGFVALEPSERYAQRAVSADGVVLALREEPNHPRGPLDFWAQVVRERLMTGGGYALRDEREVHAGSGEAGRQLRFGRDEGGEPHVYWVTLFVDADRVVIVEAGGARERFDPVAERIESAIAQVRLR